MSFKWRCFLCRDVHSLLPTVNFLFFRRRLYLAKYLTIFLYGHGPSSLKNSLFSLIKSLKTKFVGQDGGDDRLVSMLAINSDDPRSNPAELHSWLKYSLKRSNEKQKESGVGDWCYLPLDPLTNHKIHLPTCCLLSGTPLDNSQYYQWLGWGPQKITASTTKHGWGEDPKI